ncbi:MULTISPECIES: DedA family protein [Sphingomonas]|nr:MULTISPECIES: DedA family protein [Sphingomonas]KKI20235.1 membrane protein [Sphingomonas sp. Ag1]
MDEAIGRVATFIADHAIWAGPIVMLLTFGESLVVIGMLIPATALMIAIGGMIGTGLLDPASVLIWAIVGAVLGDWVSYVLGRKFGPAAFRRWPLNRYRLAAAKARLVFRRYGAASILLGRFLGPMRSTVPLVAGVLGMRQRTFQIANVVSAILWVPALLLPGYLAARSVGGVQITEMHLLAVAGIVAVITLGGSALSVRFLRRGMAPRERRALTPRTPQRDPS